MQLRSRVLAVPSRLRQLLPNLTIDDIETIDGELRQMLTEFGNDQ
jgi:phage terminase Nu1 subunit (DNA packaging protein)